MVEGNWIFYPLDKFLPVLDVGSIVPDLGVENITEAVFSHELVRHDADAFPYLMV